MKRLHRIDALGLALLLGFAPGMTSAQLDAGLDGSTRADANTGDANTGDANTGDANTGDASTLDASTLDAGPAVGEAPTTAPPEIPELPQGHRPEVSITAEPSSGVMTGDLVTLRVRAVVPDGDDVALPRHDFSPFDVHTTRRDASLVQNGRRTFVLEIDLIAFEPGNHTIEGIELRVVTSDAVVGRARTDSVTIEVGSVLGNEPDAQPRPPTAPVEVMEDDFTLLWLMRAFFAIWFIVLVTLQFARWWRRREKAEAPPPVATPPWELAIDRLQDLKRSRQRMLEAGEGEEWIDGLSDAVREYLGGRYGFDGLESTTDEVVTRLIKVHVVGIDRAEVTSLLGECDLVKFARAEVEGERAEVLLSEAFRIVRATTPVAGAKEPAVETPGPASIATAAAAATAEQAATTEEPAAQAGLSPRDIPDTVETKYDVPEPERSPYAPPPGYGVGDVAAATTTANTLQDSATLADAVKLADAAKRASEADAPQSSPHVAQEHVAQEHVAQEHVAQEHVAQEHVAQEPTGHSTLEGFAPLPTIADRDEEEKS